MITTAMDSKKASNNSGIMPRMVVTAAMHTGRTREMEAIITASKGSRVSISSLICSTSTMPFFTSMPDRLRKPSNAMKPKGAFSSSRPRVTPMMASGTVAQITSGCRRESNSSMVMMNMNR